MKITQLEGIRSDYLRQSPEEIEQAEAALRRNADILFAELVPARSSELSQSPISLYESTPDIQGIASTE